MNVALIALMWGLLGGDFPTSKSNDSGKTDAREAAESYIASGQLPDEWRTLAERTNYDETARYDETVAFCRKLAEFSPYAKYTSFGLSGEGRELPLLILSKDRRFEPERRAVALAGASGSDSEVSSATGGRRYSGKPRVLFQSCIHAGECEGKDASLALARDILVTGVHADLLDGLDLLIMPIFNVDGHERFGPYNRLNQAGPREMGWRTTAVNLNLNRDYVKADAVEMQGWLRLWTVWTPDLFLDSHTTDGSDCQYDVFYTATTGAGLDPDISSWTQNTWLPELLAGLTADGHLAIEYCFARDERDLTKGFSTAMGFVPRYSHGYGALCNRPSILLETHALKPYGRRVQTTYDMMRHTLESVNRHADELRKAVCAADARATERCGGGSDGTIPLRWRRTDASRPIVYKALEQTFRPSDVLGSEVVQYGTRPVDIETVLCDQGCVEKSVAPPAAYLIPPQWSAVIQRLDLHGVQYFRLPERVALCVRTYRFEGVKFATEPFEGRFGPKFNLTTSEETRDFAAGTVVVPMGQPRARIAAHLLEPEAPDSLVGWGFFNAIFEQKEYAEDYALEPIAQRMLNEDAALRQEFEKLLESPEFAGNAHARLDFFYRRSRYWDAALNVYPVGLLFEGALLARLR
jgi:hypothetical protein